MSFDIVEWLHLALRWAHVFAGILWIGTTYYFTWLDGRLTAEGGKVWMVHSGGFYIVEKQTAPDQMPKLHWFRWEAALTWLTGFFLLIVVYYMGGLMLDDLVSKITMPQAIGVSLGTLVLGWVLYDVLWLSPVAKAPAVGAAICYAFAVGVAFGLTRLLSGRAAYIHVGAMFGTIMTANVWMRILPAQKKLVAAIQEKRTPDAELAARSKLRSKHNTYMVMPVVFIMISSHFPSATYGNPYNWVVLAVLILVGWGAAHIVRRG
jgi:uncharacterized membrane protein